MTPNAHITTKHNSERQLMAFSCPASISPVIQISGHSGITINSTDDKISNNKGARSHSAVMYLLDFWGR